MKKTKVLKLLNKHIDQLYEEKSKSKTTEDVAYWAGAINEAQSIKLFVEIVKNKTKEVWSYGN